MEKITVEQTLPGSTYRPGTGAESAPGGSVNLGGFALSFEELLQRVGARLDQAFSAADAGSGFRTAAANDDAEPAPRNAESGREAPESRDARDDRGGRDDDGRAGRAEAGGDDTAPRDDGGRDAAHRNDDGGAKDDGAAKDGRGEGDATNNESRDDSQGGGDKAAAKTGDDAKDGGEAANGETTSGEAGARNGAETAAANAPNQAAALYAAGVVGKAASESAKSERDGTGQQAARVQETVQNLTAQTAAQAAAKTATPNRAGEQDAGAKQNGAKGQAGAKAAETAAAKTGPAHDQAQRLAQMIGAENRAQVAVKVEGENTQLTSRPTQNTVAGSILAPDPGSQSQGKQGQQQGGQQNAGNNGQNAQQIQAAALQQAQQAQQQAQTQGGPRPGGTVTGGTLGGSQGGATPLHAGGADTGGGTTVQNASSGQPLQQAQQSRDAQPQQQAQQAQRGNFAGTAVADQISVKITKALQNGMDRISIQLKPADLGRVDVKLEMTHDGRVMTVVTAEKQDTLDLLRRDSSELQRALADAGFKSGDMEFNLKGQERQQADADADETGAGAAADDADAESDTADGGDGIQNAWESGIFINGRLDMRA